MSLTWPWALLGLLAIPVLVWLDRRRRRPRATPWPSLLLWRGVAEALQMQDWCRPQKIAFVERSIDVSAGEFVVGHAVQRLGIQAHCLAAQAHAMVLMQGAARR